MYNILLTDDEQIVIDTLSFIIQKEFDDKVCIFSAYSGSEAVQIFNQTKIDIAFVDINMPGLTGLEAIREMKAASPNSVMIVLSAFDRFQYAQEAIDLGVFKYLTKPVNRNLSRNHNCNNDSRNERKIPFEKMIYVREYL